MCAETVPRLWRWRGCAHKPVACLTCALRDVQRQVELNVETLTCALEPGCAAPLLLVAVRRTVQRSGSEQLRGALARWSQRRHEARVRRDAAARGQRAVRCSACGTLSATALGSGATTCGACGAATCVQHELAATLGSDRSCCAAGAAEAQRQRENAASETTVQRTTQPCPRCGVPIEKNGGCENMVCTRCSTPFKWRG